MAKIQFVYSGNASNIAMRRFKKSLEGRIVVWYNKEDKGEWTHLELEQAKKRVEELRTVIEKNNRLYYDQDAPELEDFEYDALAREPEGTGSAVPGVGHADFADPARRRDP